MAERVGFVGDCDVVFSECVDGFLHVLDGEREVVEDAVFVVGLDELFLSAVIGQFECGSFCVWVS